ncbi:hypothetical protein EVAR_8498_1 [Eumeta japonica]|uniref:Uncharacterized protein n=1 Tax=Eumeta variegata TaxID=151549 RepID=A0A4C1XPH9_EUMVA|nr:hypothetical protein EVAR_8498_1 [Eumeta japonica]
MSTSLECNVAIRHGQWNVVGKKEGSDSVEDEYSSTGSGSEMKRRRRCTIHSYTLASPSSVGAAFPLLFEVLTPSAAILELTNQDFLCSAGPSFDRDGARLFFSILKSVL